MCQATADALWLQVYWLAGLSSHLATIVEAEKSMVHAAVSHEKNIPNPLLVTSCER
jgi:hypothetical protein